MCGRIGTSPRGVFRTGGPEVERKFVAFRLTIHSVTPTPQVCDLGVGPAEPHARTGTQSAETEPGGRFLGSDAASNINADRCCPSIYVDREGSLLGGRTRIGSGFQAGVREIRSGTIATGRPR